MIPKSKLTNKWTLADKTEVTIYLADLRKYEQAKKALLYSYQNISAVIAAYLDGNHNVKMLEPAYSTLGSKYDQASLVSEGVTKGYDEDLMLVRMRVVVVQGLKKQLIEEVASILNLICEELWITTALWTTNEINATWKEKSSCYKCLYHHLKLRTKEEVDSEMQALKASEMKDEDNAI